MPSPTQADQRGGATSAAIVALGIALLAGAAYVLLRRDTTHEFDAYWLLPRLLHGDLPLSTHPLWRTFAEAWARALAFTGADLHDRLRIACGINTGIAVGIYAHAAWLFGRDVRRTAATGLLLACLPGVSYFATVMELHAFFLPVAALATWSVGAECTGRGTTFAWSWIWCGALTAVASGVHATGHLLLVPLATMLVLSVWRRRRRGSVVLWLLGFAGVHGLGNWLWRLATESGQAPVAVQLQWVSAVPFSLRELHWVALGEWFAPFFPASLACWFGRRANSGALAIALLVALIAYLGFCQVLLVLPGGGYDFREFGAYQLPLAFLAAFLAVHGTRARGQALMLVLALSGSAHAWWFPAKERPDLAFGRVALDYVAAEPVRLMVGCFAEYDGVFEVAYADRALAPRLAKFLSVRQFQLESRRLPAVSAADMALYLHPRVAGVTTVMTAAALAQMRAAGGVFAEFADRALPSLFSLQEVKVPGANGHVLHGWRLTPK